MSQPIAPAIKRGEASLNVTSEDLFDRIINLKFIRKSGRSFTIRSDYEPVFHGDNTVSFKTCAQKPDIKITYKQVAQNVAIEVDIEVTNLFIKDSNNDNMSTASGDPVLWCIVQMGYRKQFPDWRGVKTTADLSRFWDLNNNNITSEAEVRRGRQILVQILTNYPKSYPPDKTTYFKGIIGTLDTGLRWNHSDADLIEGYGDPDFPREYSEMERVLFQFITRRFIRSSVQHIAETIQNYSNTKSIELTIENIDKKEYENFDQKIKVYGFKDYTNSGPNAVSLLRASVSAASKVKADTEWTDLPLLDNGIMSIENANKFGVICVISKTLRSLPANALYGYGLNRAQTAALRPIPATPFDSMQDSIGGQLAAIQAHYPFIRWYELTDGSFYFYHERDTDEDLWSDPFIKALQKDNTVFLPAIYDMTPSGTRTIRCPFISFVGPMSTVLFQSRFTLGTLVSYFYTPKTNAYLVITAAIEFATVQENNTMELMCVDLPPKEIIVDETGGTITVKEIEQSEMEPDLTMMQQERNMEWIEKELSVVLHKTGAMETESRWANIVKNDVLAYVQPERWPEGTVFTETAALEALKEWNPDYFDTGKEYMKRGNSIENEPTGIGGRTGIKVAWLKEGDKVTVRWPWQSEYADDKKVSV